MALTEYYVDPAINANSGTGTSGDPFGDLQYALDTVTRDSTNGDRFNIKSGTAEVLTAALSFTTYGSPTAHAPVVFEGYTSSRGDGGIGDISGGGSVSIWTSNVDYVHWVNMRLGDTGSLRIIDNTGIDWCTFFNVEFHASTNGTTVFIGSGYFFGCHWDNVSGGVQCAGLGLFDHCYFPQGAVAGTSTGRLYVSNCIFWVDNNSSADRGISVFSAFDELVVSNCSFFCDGGTGKAIQAATASAVNYVSRITNCVFSGFSGTGAVAIDITSTIPLLLYGNNAFFNCATNTSIPTPVYALTNTGAGSDADGNIQLVTDPFVNAEDGNFELAGAVAAILGWPTAFPRIFTNTYLNLGAAQTLSVTVNQPPQEAQLNLRLLHKEIG